MSQLFREDPGDYRRTWMWAVPVLAVVFVIGGQLLLLAPAAAVNAITEESVETYPTILYLIIGAFAMTALLLLAWVRLFERRSLASIGLVRDGKATRRYLEGYGIGLAMGGSTVLAIWLSGAYDLVSGPSLADLLPVLILMFAFALQSGTEEVLFRGWMLQRLTARYGVWVGIIGNSLMFMLLHIQTGTGEDVALAPIVIFNLTTFLFSIFISLLVIHHGSIWSAAAWHAAWNWMFITWFSLPTTGLDLGLAPLLARLSPTADAAPWLTGGLTGPEASVMTLVVLVIGCLMVGKPRTLSRD